MIAACKAPALATRRLRRERDSHEDAACPRFRDRPRCGPERMKPAQHSVAATRSVAANRQSGAAAEQREGRSCSWLTRGTVAAALFGGSYYQTVGCCGCVRWARTDRWLVHPCVASPCGEGRADGATIAAAARQRLAKAASALFVQQTFVPCGWIRAASSSREIESARVRPHHAPGCGASP
eukprot:6845067-Prymnesium_polylepis.1